jgi:hypothetical protein
MTSSHIIARWFLVAGTFASTATIGTAQERSAQEEVALRREAERRSLEMVVEQLAQTRGTVAIAPQTIQRLNVAGSDPLSGPVVKNAPYSGDAVTTVTQILGDGTRIEQNTTAKFYRDSAGRVRREQTIIGLAALRTRQGAGSGDAQTLITVDPDPDDGLAFQLDVTARTARRVPRAAAGLGFNFNTFTINWAGPLRLSPQDDRTVEQSLGTRTIEGVKATGRKTTLTIPTGEIGNDRPIEVTDERWESPELQVIVYSRHSDPRTGVVEYRLTNINRLEPPLDLFTVPPDYTIIEGGRGQRTGGAGGRGTPGAPGARGGRQ